MTYVNTTESTGEELKIYRKKALTQEQRILEFLKQDPTRPITPSAAVRWVFKDSVPITSVRRALTELTNEGHLVKTEAQTRGPFGRPERIWRLADKYLQGELF